MKFIVQRESILPALQSVNGAVERRQSLPILSNVMVVLENSQLTLTATDMEVEIVSSVNLDSDQSCSFTAPARKFLDIVKALPAGASIEVSVTEKQVALKSGRSRFALTTMPVTDFPNVGDFESLVSFSIPGNILRALIADTQFAMAHQDVRYYLNGLLLELTGSTVRAVATDGHRLALAETDLDHVFETPQQLIVPRKGVGELARILDDTEDLVTVGVNDNHVQVSIGAERLTSKLIDGKFPDYDRVIPAATDKEIVADREVLKQGLSRASILSNEKFRGIRIILDGNTLKAVAHNPEQEEAEEEIEVEHTGGDLEVGFNVSYLLDVLNTVSTEKVRMAMSDANSSCLLTPDSESRRKYVVMPMRL